MSDYKKLIPGKTLIGKFRTKRGNASCYYGNYCVYEDYDENDIHQKKSFNLSKETYLQKLEIFINSSLGKEYEIPTEEEIGDAMSVVLRIQADEEEERRRRIRRVEEAKREEEESNIQDDSPNDEGGEESPESDEEYSKEQEYDEETENSTPLNSDSSKSNKKNHTSNSNRLFVFTTALFGLSTLLLAANTFGLITLPLNSKKNVSTVDVVALNTDVSNNTVITEEMIYSKTISADEYKELSNQIKLDGNGNLINDYGTLWVNKDKIVGTYTTKSLTANTILTDSDISILGSDETTITMNIDGTEVTVPKTFLENGDSSVKLYAIISTKNVATESNYGVFLGEMNLGKRNISSILDSAGEDLLNPSFDNGSVINQESQPDYVEPTVEENTEAGGDYYNDDSSESTVNEYEASQG